MKRALLLLAAGFLVTSSAAEELLEQLSPEPLQAEAVMEALEPWETPIEGFFIRSHHGVPDIDVSTWTLRIDGLVESPQSLTLAHLRRLPAKSLYAVLECAGNGRGLQSPRAPGLQWKRGAVGNAEWSGVPLADLLQRAKVRPEARFARLEGADVPLGPGVPAFVRSVPLAKLLEGGSLLALSMNREPLPALHGGPARVILPGWYGQNWMKWVTRITLTEEEDPGFFMKKGYRMPKSALEPDQAWDSSTGKPIEEILVQSLIVFPVAGRAVPAGALRVRGKAFSGAGPVARVEVSLDGGRTWRLSELEAPRPEGGWQAFEAAVTVSTGPLTVLSRATDAAGNSQPMEHAWNPSGYLRNAVDQVSVLVSDHPLPPGLAVLSKRCLSCHAQELIDGQRLTAKQWGGVVKKMEGFGVLLEADERQALLDYLAGQDPRRPEAAPLYIGYAWKDASRSAKLPSRGDSSRGRKAFSENCASCHGERAEGREGPRLAGRRMDRERFRLTVLHGKRGMPGFAEGLTAQEIADIAQWLAASSRF